MEDWQVLSSSERERDVAMIAAYFWASPELTFDGLEGAVSAALEIYKLVLKRSKETNE